jgi:adenylate cyclase
VITLPFKKFARLFKRLGFGRLLALAVLGVLLALRVANVGPLETLRLKTWDAFQQLSPRVPQQFTVRVVDVDEASLKAIGQWPWPRTILADLITRLHGAGAVVVGFDAVFAEPDRLSPGLIADQVSGLDEATREKLRTLPSNESAMAQAIKRARVVLGQVPDTTPVAADSVIDPSAPRTSVATLGPDPSKWLIGYPRLIRNLPELETAAAGRGLFAVEPDRDGVVRRVPAVLAIDKKIYPGLATEVLRVATGTPTILVRTDPSGVRSIVIAGIEIPTDRNGQMRPHFARYDKRRYISAADVLAGKMDPAAVRGKLVLVGSTAASLFDLRATPLDRTVSGVELNAQALESMIDKSLLMRPGTLLLSELLVALLVGLGIVALVPVLGAARVLILGSGTLVLLAGVAWGLFRHKSLLTDLSFPALATFCTFAVLTFHNYLREEARRTEISRAFSRYVSPELVQQIADQPDKLRLGGETRELSVLFSDVRGFTGIAELYRDDPQGLASFMNRLLTPLTNAILATRGTIDKYMGDAVLAFWNAPLDDSAHAEHACRSALDMLERMRRLNEERQREADAGGLPYRPIAIGIGINTGMCTVGNMGSDLRFDYSVLGDSVNVASRLESLTKSYGVSTLVGAETARQARHAVTTLAIDDVRVKGKNEPAEVHTIVGDAAIRDDAAFQKLAASFAAMRTAYRAQDWPAATAAISVCRTDDASGRVTGLLDLYANRVARCVAEPMLPADWDGVWVLTSKE